MKTLTQHIVEKLIINRNYKNVDDIESMLDNIEFEHGEDVELVTRDDIFSMMVEYIRDNNVRSFSDFYSYQKTATEDNDACLAVFNKRIKKLLIFKKISYDTYYCFIIYNIGRWNHSVFKRRIRSFSEMNALKNAKVWTNTDEVEYYEISEETFECISKLYDKLGRK